MYAMSKCVNAGRMQGITLLDSVFLDIGDSEAIAARWSVSRACRMPRTKPSNNRLRLIRKACSRALCRHC